MNTSLEKAIQEAMSELDWLFDIFVGWTMYDLAGRLSVVDDAVALIMDEVWPHFRMNQRKDNS